MDTLAKRFFLYRFIQGGLDNLTMRRITTFVFSVLLVLMSANSGFAQKTKYQSIFIYNFSKYIKWPDSYNQGKFVIGVLGDAELLKDLQAMTSAKKQTNGLVMEVQHFKTVESITDCNLLFVSNKFCNQINQVQAAISGKPMLIITDKKGMAQNGAVINFVEDAGKIKFELNQSAANQLGLVISGSLASLAILV